MCVGIDLAMQNKQEQNKIMLLNNILLTYTALGDLCTPFLYSYCTFWLTFSTSHSVCLKISVDTKIMSLGNKSA